VHVDGPLLDLARRVMGQAETAKKGSALLEAWASTPPPNGGGEDPTTTTSTLAPIGRGGVTTAVHSRWLHRWQRVWLAALRDDGGDRGGGGSINGPHGPSYAGARAYVLGEPDILMTCVGSAAAGIDPRVWAYLRVLYADSEDDLRKHGYSPTTLQSPSAMLDGPPERHAIRTLMGILGVALSGYETDLEDDCTRLRLGVQLSGRGGAGVTGTGTGTGPGTGGAVMNEFKRGDFRDPVKTARTHLRRALGGAPPPPLSVQLMGTGLGVCYFDDHHHHHHHHHQYHHHHHHHHLRATLPPLTPFTSSF
jgi:hypothetical protein